MHVFPAALIHVAVAVAPTFKQVIARFSRGEAREADVRAVAATRTNFMVDGEIVEWEDERTIVLI